jgi:serine/threonine protein kinase
MSDVRGVAGRYEILREIGRGGMATVYLARQLDLDRLVALKELGGLRTSDQQFAQRFLREAQLAGSLSHPNIVTVYDYFVDDGAPYIAMEYVERGSLRPHVGRMSLAQIGGVLEAVLAGLMVAERRQIVHRDLKPENLLVTAEGGIKISDFGIAKATNDLNPGAGLTATGVAVGTPNYMAPEQATAQNVGAWTDLYSVGIIAYEFFLGRPPFDDTNNAVGVLLRQVNETIPAAIDIDPSIDATISNWIARMVAKDPAARPESAAAAWDELEDTFLALLGPRWRRHARLATSSPALTIPPAAVLVDSAADLREAATVPPHIPPVVTANATAVPKRKRSGLPVKLLFAGVAVVALSAAMLGRSGGSPGPASALDGIRTTLTQPVPSPEPTETAPRPNLTAQAKSAQKLAAQYDHSAAQVARLAAARVRGGPTERLVRALRGTAGAYRAAAKAAAAGDMPAYATAIQTAASWKGAVNAALDDVRRGSRGSTPSEPAEQQQQQPGGATPCSGDSVSDDPSDDGC